MKILYLCNEFPLLSETFLIYEIYDMLQLGADVRVLSFSTPEKKQRSDLPEKLGFEDRIYSRPALIKSSAKRRARKLKLLFGLLLKGNSRAFFKLMSDKQSALEYSRYILQETVESLHMDDGWTPDILHCHFATVGRFAAIMKHYHLTDVRVSTVFHGYDISRVPQEQGLHYYDILFEQGDLFLCVNKHYLEKIRDLGAPENKSELFHMGVDIAAFPYQPHSFRQGEAVRFISIGRMTEKKGHEFTLRAFAKAMADKPALPMHLDMIGDGPLRDALEALLKELGIEGYVTLHGVLQHSEVKTYLDRAHVFVLPSVTAENGDMEGIPVVLMEAMAGGLPVISTRHSGIPDLVEDGETGYLVSERDVDGLARLMVQMAENPQKWSDMTEKARMKVENDFNRQQQAEKLYRLFEQQITVN